MLNNMKRNAKNANHPHVVVFIYLINLYYRPNSTLIVRFINLLCYEFGDNLVYYVCVLISIGVLFIGTLSSYRMAFFMI